MASAYILVEIKVGEEEKVLEKIKSIEGVVDAYLVFGKWDLIAKINAEDVNKLKKSVLQQIRSLKELNHTMTLICVDD